MGIVSFKICLPTELSIRLYRNLIPSIIHKFETKDHAGNATKFQGWKPLRVPFKKGKTWLVKV